MRKSEIAMFLGSFLIALSLLLTVFSISGVTVKYEDSAIIVEIHPLGGMSPKLYYILVAVLFLVGFVSLLMAIFLTRREMSGVSGHWREQRKK